MKWLLRILLLWSFIGMFSYKAFPESMQFEFIKLNASVTMFLVALVFIKHNNFNYSFVLLALAVLTLFSRIHTFLHTLFNIPVDQVYISWFSITALLTIIAINSLLKLTNNVRR